MELLSCSNIGSTVSQISTDYRSLRIGLVIPTLNAGDGWNLWIKLLASQTMVPLRILVIDSSSQDCTRLLAEQAGYEVLKITREEFNHGATRQLAADILSETDILIYLTQDAFLDNHFSLEYLVSCFKDETVGAAYGRQLPHANAKPIGSHARLFNYPAVSEVRSIEDAPRLGIKTAFISNSFAAYRRTALLGVGGFPSNIILSEDTYVASKILFAGWKIAYCAEATVLHSHDYSFIPEFKRYFDVGVFHSREAWIRESFGNAEGEGKRFVLSELAYLFRCAPWLIPSSIIRTGLKYFGFRLGLMEKSVPNFIKRKISMHREYWK